MQSTDMRLTEEFLRQSLTAQHPLRMHKVAEQPLYFQGTRDTLAYAGVLPGRAGGGIYYFQLAVTHATDAPSLVLARMLPDTEATTLPDFDAADKSSLANGIAEVRFSYFGRDTDSNVAVDPTWRRAMGRPERPAPDDPHRRHARKRRRVAPLIVEPRLAPEVGCRSWDINRNRCIGT